MSGRLVVPVQHIVEAPPKTSNVFSSTKIDHNVVFLMQGRGYRHHIQRLRLLGTLDDMVEHRFSRNVRHDLAGQAA
jgi:deoxyribodipyrimidine photolyase-like uncharacterized protein